MKKAAVSTLLHTIELAVVVAVAIVVLKVLNVDSETTIGITTVVLGALAKYARASEDVPIKDYVNK